MLLKVTFGWVGHKPCFSQGLQHSSEVVEMFLPGGDEHNYIYVGGRVVIPGPLAIAALCRLKGMVMKWHNPKRVGKAVLSHESRDSDICQYPLVKSNDEMKLAVSTV